MNHVSNYVKLLVSVLRVLLGSCSLFGVDMTNIVRFYKHAQVLLQPSLTHTHTNTTIASLEVTEIFDTRASRNTTLRLLRHLRSRQNPEQLTTLLVEQGPTVRGRPSSLPSVRGRPSLPSHVGVALTNGTSGSVRCHDLHPSGPWQFPPCCAGQAEEMLEEKEI